MTLRTFLAFLATGLLAAVTACSNGTGAPDAPEAAGVTSSAPAATAATVAPKRQRSGNAEQPQIITDDLLQAWARGLEVEAEILRRPGRGTHYGVMVSEGTEEGDLVLEAAGITAADYNHVARTVGGLFSILNARGEFGPKLIHFDLDRVGEELRQRLTGDPYADLPPESAEAIRRNLDLLRPLWLDVTGMTAQHG